MNPTAKGFLIGPKGGVAVTAAFGYFMSTRYKIQSSGREGMIKIRIDTWTGKTWMYSYIHSERSDDVVLVADA